MKHSVKTLLILLVAATTASVARAGDEFGLWTEAGITKSLSKKFSIGADLEYRANDNLGSTSRISLGIGANYKPIKALRLGAGYVLIDQHNLSEKKVHFNNSGNWNGFNVDHNYWRLKNRFYVDVAGKINVDRFTFSLRERYQATLYSKKDVDRDKYRGEVSESYTGQKLYGEYQGTGRWYAFDDATTDTKEAKTKHYLRSKIGAEYNIRHCPLTPFASFEISNNLSDGFSLDKRRWTVGVDYKIKKKHTLSLSYIYTNGNDDDDDPNLHAICVGYNFKF